jgi:DNA-binding transcriptional regulator YhcF (GntR family)
MKFWLSKTGNVAVRDQLAAQIILGIVSRDLKADEKLPSTRELARRLKIHANTVSAAYRELARSGWVEFRKGSGVYVRERTESPETSGKADLDALISGLFHAARDHGYSLQQIRSKLQRRLGLRPPERLLVIEPDAGLQRILVAEIADATGLPVAGSTIEDLENGTVSLDGAAVVAMLGQAESVRMVLPAENECMFLYSRSITDALAGQQRPSNDALITIASEWPGFLRWAHTVLVAAGLSADSINSVDAQREGWVRGLKASAFVIADVLTARKVPASSPVRVFRVIADRSISELRAYAEEIATPQIR